MPTHSAATKQSAGLRANFSRQGDRVTSDQKSDFLEVAPITVLGFSIFVGVCAIFAFWYS
jgi:hypothetical protein